MTIPVVCPGCHAHYNLGEPLAGTSVRCPACSQAMQVPPPLTFHTLPTPALPSLVPGGSGEPDGLSLQSTLQDPATNALDSSRTGHHSAAAPGVIPGYEILGELGRGGMGVVYKARQVNLNRLVALKMILVGPHAAAPSLARFRAEAEAVARLRHPGIVQIHEIGEANGLPYFSLELVDGGSLDRQLAGTPLPPEQAAHLAELLARAVAHAHQQGIVHRDLKPANVLLARSDRPEALALGSEAADSVRCEPKITDFGLAKQLDSAEAHTQSGAILGTPEYMAPEQAGGSSKDMGPATDVYALGAVLYECLTGRPPFKSASRLETLMQLVVAEPVPPSRLQPGVPRDLETICLKCLEKEPRKRYASATALAEDLRRFRAGEPITARPVGGVERAVKWVKRRPAVAALLGVMALALLLLLGGGAYFTVRLAEERDEAQARKKDADQLRHKAEALAQKEANARRQAVKDRQAAEEERDRTRYQLLRAETARHAITMDLALRSWQAHDVAYAEALLAETQPQFQDTWEYRHLSGLCRRKGLALRGHGGAVHRVAFSPDGRRVATACLDKSDQTARVWDSVTGQELLVLRGHTAGVSGVAFSPDGTRLATASADQTARVWDSATGRHLLTLGHTSALVGVAFSPDGGRLATGSVDKTAQVWDAATGRQQLTLRGHTGVVREVVFSPDGSRLATASRDKTARVWDAATGQQQLVLQGHTAIVAAVAFSPDGKRLATGGDRTGRVWDSATGRQLLAVQVHADILPGARSVAFSPDGKRLATGAGDGVARVWDAATGQQLLALRGHLTGVYGVAFSPDGQRLATAGDGMARVWDASVSQPLLTLRCHPDRVRDVAFSGDGRHLVTGGADPLKTGMVRVWDAATGRQRLVFPDHTPWVNGVAFSPDGRRLATTSSRGTPRLWDAGTGGELLALSGHEGRISSVTFSSDGRRLASACSDKSDPTARVWDATTGKELLILRGHTEGVSGVAFSPDGKRLATASSDKTARLWDAATGQQLLTLDGHTGGVSGVAFRFDGQRLATAGDRTARVWDAATGKELLTLRGHTSSVLAVAFNPDGRRLVSASEDGTVRVWDAPAIPPAAALKGLKGGS